MASVDFYQAPASKALFFGSGLGTIGASLFLKTPLVGYDVMAFTGMKLHRVFFGQLFFGSVGELVLGLGLIYQFRLFERRMGTAKFLSYTLLSTIISISIQMLVLAAYPGFNNPQLTRMAPGPYAHIFALLVHYIAFVPKLSKRRILGAEVSEKTLVYLWGSQLLFARGRESALTGLCGFAGGLLCATDRLPFKRLELPESFKAFGRKYLSPLFASRSPEQVAADRTRLQRERLTRMGLAAQGLQAQGIPGANQQQQGEQLIPGNGSLFGDLARFQQQQQQQQRQQVPEPNEEQVNTLTAMGFERTRVLAALRAHNNDTERAANSLLQG